MAIYQSDGKKLLNVEYDVVPQLNDIIDGMMVLSVDLQNIEEYAVFLLEPTTRRVICYIFDEIFIIGKSDEFDTLNDAIEAWKNGEI